MPKYGIDAFPVSMNVYTEMKLLFNYKLDLVNIGCRQLSRDVHQRAIKLELAFVTQRLLKD